MIKLCEECVRAGYDINTLRRHEQNYPHATNCVEAAFSHARQPSFERKAMKTKRKRVTADQVRKTAKDGGGQKWFNLPSGIEIWQPTKPGTYYLDILPYTVTDENHPDGIEKDVLWYQREIYVHFKEGTSYLCPKSKNKDAFCYDCREFFKRLKAGTDKEDLRSFSRQKFHVYNILNQEDKDAIALFCMKSGKFWDCNQGAGGLKKELEEAEADDLLFFSCNKGEGRTLKVRFSEKKFKGNKFLQATQILFKKRKSMDEDDILKRVVNLDKALKIYDKEKLKKLFEQADDEDSDSPKGIKKKKKGKLKKKASAKRAKELAKKYPSPLKHQRDDEDEETPKKQKGKKLKKKCPIKGGKFGRDCDKFKKCAKCPLYTACEKASGE